MSANRCLVDTNILLRWVKPDDRDYQLVKEATDCLLRNGVMLCCTSQNLAEFWNTCTRPADRNGYGLSVSETDARAQILESLLVLLPDNVALHHEWRRIVVDNSVSGVQVHDARLVAAMRVHGVRQILTFNEKDFSRYAGIEAVSPQMVLDVYR